MAWLRVALAAATLLFAPMAWSQPAGPLVVRPPSPVAGIPFHVDIPVEVCFLDDHNPYGVVGTPTVSIAGTTISIDLVQVGPTHCLGSLTTFVPYEVTIGPLPEGTYDIVYRDDPTFSAPFQRFTTVTIRAATSAPTLGALGLVGLAVLMLLLSPVVADKR